MQPGANQSGEEPILPGLREDLVFSPGGPGEDGGPTWLLYDPLQHRYFKIGARALFMLSKWEAHAVLGPWLEGLRAADPDITQQEAEQLIAFLTLHGLTVSSSPKARRLLEMRHKRTSQGWLQWLITHYLYIKIPLIRPDRFLAATLGHIAPLYHPAFTKIIVLLGVVGMLLIVRQWEVFRASILHFFNLRGALFFGITLFFVKAIHELGHGYTAKRHGCRVPTMGVAFLVLYPFLYTDTTDTWRLTSKKQRLAVVTAGVKTELALACLASFAWSFLDQGILKSMAFFVCTTSWISSLTINLSPFMRFDGYYALVDILGAENLQQRAFALARWHLRETVFGFNDPPPEALTKERRRIFLAYAYATWIYRFTLFLGIALLVYHLAFKALGVVLFCIEIMYFLFMPIGRELLSWWKKRRQVSMNRHAVVTLMLLLAGTGFLIIPWQGHVLVPAVVESREKITLFPGEDAVLSGIHVSEGDRVAKGDLLFELSFPELEKMRSMTERRIAHLMTRIDRHVGSASDLDQLDILEHQLAEERTTLEGIRIRIQRGRIASPLQGRVSTRLAGQAGQWVAREQSLAQVVGENGCQMTAYVSEDELWRIRKGASAIFYARSGDNPPIAARVKEIDEAAVSLLAHPETSALHGGSIPVRELASHALRPEEGTYKIGLEVQKDTGDLPWRLSGTVRIEAPGHSLIAHFIRFATSVLIRESGM